MTDNLISDLRLNAEHQLLVIEDYRRAADRIERLETALEDALQYVSRADWHYLKDETRKTLEGKDG